MRNSCQQVQCDSDTDYEEQSPGTYNVTLRQTIRNSRQQVQCDSETDHENSRQQLSRLPSEPGSSDNKRKKLALEPHPRRVETEYSQTPLPPMAVPAQARHSDHSQDKCRLGKAPCELPGPGWRRVAEGAGNIPGREASDIERLPRGLHLRGGQSHQGLRGVDPDSVPMDTGKGPTKVWLPRGGEKGYLR
ncbi:hypothetical protein ACRRTK_004407 [Alexandromys fortis]